MFEQLPLISSRSGLIAEVREQLLAVSPDNELVSVDGELEAREFLLLEMPRVFLIDMADPAFDAFSLIDDIIADPWLLYGGMIAIHDSPAVARRLAELQGSNLIMALAEKDLARYLLKVLGIIRANARLTVQRDLGAEIVRNVSAGFQLGNDPVEAGCYVNLICNFLFNAGRIDLVGKRQMHMVLMELLMNAIEHGNCGIDFKQKSDWLESGRPIHELVDVYAARTENRDKRISFEYSLEEARASFRITDEGPGFDWAELMLHEQPADPLALHGRGILLCRQIVERLTYNEAGNEVHCDIAFPADAQTSAPRLFQDRSMLNFKAGDIVLREGESSSHLYYIARGTYLVKVDQQTISRLTPDDIFLGEMSFLLGNRRNADVIAETDGSLIAISRKDFVQAIHRHPHYGVFLARLLAQRLVRNNQAKAAELKVSH